MQVKDATVFGFIKTKVDVHILGYTAIANALRNCGYTVYIAPQEVMEAVENVTKLNNSSQVADWIRKNNINILSFSYRLDPNDGADLFCKLYHQLRENKLFIEDGGSVEKLFFAGLEDSCNYVRDRLGAKIGLFKGGEPILESLRSYNIPEERIPTHFVEDHEYDRSLKEFGKKVIESGKFNKIEIPDHYGYPECGTNCDSYLHRLEYCRNKRTLPMIRVHAGPYSPDRADAIMEFIDWTKQLARTRLLDVLSIGSSQLTQQHFGENWDGMSNGGGVPVNSELEYRIIAEAAKPMLVRTYAGTNKVPWMAEMHERTLNISWHALSFWWFCELDGRGTNTVLENLYEHIDTIKYIASTGKPLEPNVPHHFSFRGGDDVTYIVSAYLAAKTAKKYGIRHLILQNMLNTPKTTWGIQDLAKSRAMLKLIRSLEDSEFKISLQTRAGLDYFKPDLEAAMVQLAAVTALMDDIEPNNPNSPEIIHVVSYSEAVRLATPDIIEKSIKITLNSLQEYRNLKLKGATYPTVGDSEIEPRTADLYEESSQAIEFLERNFPNLYSPEGLHKVYKMGFLPTPYIYDPDHKFPEATKWQTANINGSVKVVDEKGLPIPTLKRYRDILLEYGDQINI